MKLYPADVWFATYIKIRDNYTCVRCHKQYVPNKNGKTPGLTCSHYWSRIHQATRFSLENCDAVCFGCHELWEHDKQGEYRNFKLKQLGQKEYDLLEWRHNQYCKKDYKYQELVWKNAVNKLK
jgi:hypothetical protein